MILASIAFGGAIGSVLRYLIQIQSAQWFGTSFPYGTLVVNIIGSLCIGFLSFVLLERFTISEELRLAILVGFLGGFTTFSTFSIETLNLIQQGNFSTAVGNILLSICACLLACFIGMSIARSI